MLKIFLLKGHRRMLFISLAGHLVVFALFGFSFGKRIAKADYPSISFWGQFFKDLGLNAPVGGAKRKILPKMPQRPPLFLKNGRLFPADIKPHSTLSSDKKPSAVRSFFAKNLSLEKKESAIIFYPSLPYTFPLYFQDRQTAHVELLFKITKPDKQGFILVKRKISSGNLEADLLTMRYIGRHLFMEKGDFPLDTWQTVKIDLSRER